MRTWTPPNPNSVLSVACTIATIIVDTENFDLNTFISTLAKKHDTDPEVCNIALSATIVAALRKHNPQIDERLQNIFLAQAAIAPSNNANEPHTSVLIASEITNPDNRDTFSVGVTTPLNGASPISSNDNVKKIEIVSTGLVSAVIELSVAFISYFFGESPDPENQQNKEACLEP